MTPKFCREVQAQLPALAGGELSGWSDRTVRAHLRRCRECAGQWADQQQLGTGLSALRAHPPEPPAQLLDTLLDQAREPGLRARAAVPARGALSGARPELSVAFLTVGALASTALGWAAWQGGRSAWRHGARLATRRR